MRMQSVRSETYEFFFIFTMTLGHGGEKHRLTLLIETNALLLCETTTSVRCLLLIMHLLGVEYEGCSMNKLQNCAIPLILKIRKSRNKPVVKNLILNIQRNFY